MLVSGSAQLFFREGTVAEHSDLPAALPRGGHDHHQAEGIPYPP